MYEVCVMIQERVCCFWSYHRLLGKCPLLGKCQGSNFCVLNGKRLFPCTCKHQVSASSKVFFSREQKHCMATQVGGWHLVLHVSVLLWNTNIWGVWYVTQQCRLLQMEYGSFPDQYNRFSLMYMYISYENYCHFYMYIRTCIYLHAFGNWQQCFYVN